LLADVPHPVQQTAPVARCHEPARHYRCPNLVMARPSRLVLRRTPKGRLLLLMDNYLVNRGPGRVQFRGHRASEYVMDAVQIVDRTGGRFPLPVQTGATLVWKHVDSYRGSYWKFSNAARFELYKLDITGHRTKLYRYGPKQDYCLRDLFRFGRGSAVPPGPVFGACSQNFRASRDTLGISVGWADGYPYSYPENWIDVTGRRGCFVVVHRADPLNHVLETDEDDNTAHRVVRLPYRPGDQHCPRYRGPEVDG
jgi:hypothetical protein